MAKSSLTYELVLHDLHEHPNRDKKLLETFKNTYIDPVLQTLWFLLNFFPLTAMFVRCKVVVLLLDHSTCVNENMNFVCCVTLYERSWKKDKTIRLYTWTPLDVKFPVKYVNSIESADVSFKCNGNALGRKYFSTLEFGTPV